MHIPNTGSALLDHLLAVGRGIVVKTRWLTFVGLIELLGYNPYSRAPRVRWKDDAACLLIVSPFVSSCTQERRKKERKERKERKKEVTFCLLFTSFVCRSWICSIFSVLHKPALLHILDVRVCVRKKYRRKKNINFGMLGFLHERRQFSSMLQNYLMSGLED